MAKIKMFAGMKKCPSGEKYIFRNGIALVPGCIYAGKPMKISIVEFREISKGINNES